MKRTEGEIKREHGQAYVISLNTESDVFILARCGEDIHSPETFANADHIAVTWNASKGMTTKQAGLYLEHGAEMVRQLKKIVDDWESPENVGWDVISKAYELIAKMESE